MRFTTGAMQTAAVGGLALLAIGLALTASGALQESLPHTLGGSALVVTALAAITLTLIRQWVCSTNRERDELTRARQRAEEAERKYFALQVATEGEAGRMRRDLNAERYAVAQNLIDERRVLETEFENRRLELCQQAFREGVQMERAGLLLPEQQMAALLKFPG